MPRWIPLSVLIFVIMILLSAQYASANDLDSLLCGEYVVVSYEIELAGYFGDFEQWETRGRYSLLTFDGQGNADYQDIFSTGSLDSGSFSYSVNEDGTFQIQGEDPNTIRIVSPDEQNIILAEVAEGELSFYYGIVKSDAGTYVEDDPARHSQQKRYTLQQNYRNPFNSA